MSLQTLEKRVDAMDIRLETLEKKVDSGFVNLSSQIEYLAVSVKNGFDQINERFDQMDDRFDRVENVSIGGHERRIENIEDDIRIIKTKIGLRKK